MSRCSVSCGKALLRTLRHAFAAAAAVSTLKPERLVKSEQHKSKTQMLYKEAVRIQRRYVMSLLQVRFGSNSCSRL